MPDAHVEPEARLDVAIGRIAARTAGRSASARTHDAADDTFGTIESDDAIGFDPRPVLLALAERRAPAVVMGQVAGILHGSTELTGDLDLLWSGLPVDAPSMGLAFGALNARMTYDDGVAVSVADAFGLPKALFRTPTAAGDCCTPRLDWKGLDVAAFIDRALTAEIGGFVFRYLRLDDLIAMRRAAGRPKDLRRAAELERIATAGDSRPPPSPS